MDWTLAIERNRAALKRVLAMLVTMAGLQADGTCSTLPRHLHRAVLRLLRPAESAARRLVIVAARGLVLVRPRRGQAEARRGQRPARPPHLGFALFDPLRPIHAPRRRQSAVPRLCVPGLTPRFAVPLRPAPSPEDAVSAARLALRLAALARALDDLPGHARRFARWQARRDGAAASPAASGRQADDAGRRTEARPRPRFRRIWPLRPGRPPGAPRRASHPVHDILDVVHGLAFEVLERRDTS